LTPISTGEMLQINLASTGGAFGTSGLSDDVGAVFTSMIDFPEAGVWTLYTESDDGSKLLVDGTLVVDNDGLHGMVEVGGTIEVTEPGPMAVRVEFFERGGGAGLIVRWEGPGVAKAVVPSSAWRPAG
ncbi:MAG: PA14 domain-containing protein, partial [Planctomycetota bacterium]